MPLEIQVSEEELRETFADTLGKETSFSGIIIIYKENKESRIEIGVPYSITNNNLEIGPYFKDISTFTPNDYNKRKKQIPICSIIKYKRIKLSDII